METFYQCLICTSVDAQMYPKDGTDNYLSTFRLRCALSTGQTTWSTNAATAALSLCSSALVREDAHK